MSEKRGNKSDRPSGNRKGGKQGRKVNQFPKGRKTTPRRQFSRRGS